MLVAGRFKNGSKRPCRDSSLAGWLTRGINSVGFIPALWRLALCTRPQTRARADQHDFPSASRTHEPIVLRAARRFACRELLNDTLIYLLSFAFVSLQRAKMCTRDRCCQSRPSPWRSASWEPCVWPSTAATSERTSTLTTTCEAT